LLNPKIKVCSKTILLMTHTRLSSFYYFPLKSFVSKLLLVLCMLATGAVNAVTYEVTFNATWSAADLEDASDYPGSAHFSPLIGTTHVQAAEFWEEGGSASFGVKKVAEEGSNSELKSELLAAKNTGTTGDVIEFSSLFGLPNSDSLEIEVEASMPFITLITMIAPSPDWFVGVSGQSLMDQGVWVENLTIDLKAYDAGTEEGDQFSLDNSATPVPEVISKLFGTDSPFQGRPTLGTLTFTLKDPPPPPPPPSSGNAAWLPAIISDLL